MKPSSTRPFVVQPVQERVVPERRPAFVHHLRLALRIEVLRELAHDADELALPRLELRRVLLDEVEDVLLRLRREACRSIALARRRRPSRQRAPQVVELPLRGSASRAASRAVSALSVELLRAGGSDRRRAFISAWQASSTSSTACGAVALLALHHVVPREDEVVEDRLGVGPLPEQVVALEEGVVAVARVRDDERLHRHRVLFHQVGDARDRVDDDLVGEPHAWPRR